MRVHGDRLTIITNGGGAGVLAVDALADRRLSAATLGTDSIAALDRVLPGAWSHGNPVDILGDAKGDRYAAALEIVMADPASDAVLVLNCPTALAAGEEAAQAVASAVDGNRAVPVLTNWLGGDAAIPARAILGQHRIPNFDSPEQAVRAFGHLVEFRRNQTLLLETPSAGVAIPRARVEEARTLIETVRGEARTILTEPEAKHLLALFGIPTVPTRIANDPAEAGRLAEDIGGPVAVKIHSPDITHKSDVGGVALRLASAAAAQAAAEEMLSRIAALRPDARNLRFTVQAMVTRPQAHELILGLARDPTFGPVILFGEGGTATEVVADRSIGLPPLNSVLAQDMIAHTQISRRLAGYRHIPPAPMGQIVDVLLRLSEIAVHLPDIVELDINPLLADAQGLIALDARVVISETRADAPLYAITPYPAELEQAFQLSDGQNLMFRPIRPEDEVPISEMVTLCTPEDLRMRFLGPVKHFQHDMAARLSQIDYDREMAFVAVEAGAAYGAGPIYGVVRIAGDPERATAEFAIIVRSDMKGRGLGYRLLAEIIAHARRAGYAEVYGDVFSENTAMLGLAEELGFVLQAREPGEDTRRVRLVLRPGQQPAA
jgi:acetyltransferase